MASPGWTEPPAATTTTIVTTTTCDVVGLEGLGDPVVVVDDGTGSSALPTQTLTTTCNSAAAPTSSRGRTSFVEGVQDGDRSPLGRSTSAGTVGTGNAEKNTFKRLSKSESGIGSKSKFFSDPSFNNSGRRSGSLEGLAKRNWLPQQVRLIFMSSGPPDTTSSKREMLQTVMRSNAMEAVVGAVIFFNFVLLMLETDCSAAESGCLSSPAWVTVGMDICYVIFVLEFVLRVAAERWQWCYEVWNWVDAFIVFTGTLEYVFTIFHVNLSGFSILRILRLFRLLRLMRMLRLFTFLKELRTLLGMMGTCFKTLFWSFCLLCVIMSIWAIIAVEILNPYVIELADLGTWKTCSRCRLAFSSVWMANLTFFQTTVAADSWGEIAVPVIEAHPYTALIFIGAMLTLLFGILNLILAVVVDTCAQNREKDISAKSAEMAEEEQVQKRELTKMFLKIDNDNSNAISWEELRDGACRVREFRQWLRVMDIDARDLRQLFDIVDEDGSGEIDADEFIDAMYRMRNADAKTASKFSKHLVTKLCDEQKAMRDEFEAKMLGLVKAVKMDEVCLEQKLHMQERAVQLAIENAMKRATAVAQELLSSSLLEERPPGSAPSLPTAPLLSDCKASPEAEPDPASASQLDMEPLPSLFGQQAGPSFRYMSDRFKEIAFKYPSVAPELKNLDGSVPEEVASPSWHLPFTSSPSFSENGRPRVPASPTGSLLPSLTPNASPRGNITIPKEESKQQDCLIEVKPGEHSHYSSDRERDPSPDLSPRTSQRKQRLESIGLTVTNAASLRDPHRDDVPPMLRSEGQS